MRKILKYFLILLFSAALSFGGGIGIAQFQISSKINSQPKVIIPVPEKLSEPALPEEKTPVLLSGPSEEQVSPPDNNNDEKLIFAVMGDTQRFDPGNPNGGFQKAVRQIRDKNVDLTVAVGDLVSSCGGGAECEGKYTLWKNTFGTLVNKTYAAQGNHDRTGREKADAAWQSVFSFPTNGPAGFSELAYSFDVKNAHFVVLDSEKPNEHVVDAVQRNWLERDLSTNKKEHTFVFFHEPAYPVSSKINESLDVKPGERNALWDILSRHKVTAVFSGHEHIASRRKVNGVYQFGFGNTDSFNHDAPKPGLSEWSYVGENFATAEVDDQKVTVNTYSVDGKLINTFSF